MKFLVVFIFPFSKPFDGESMTIERPHSSLRYSNDVLLDTLLVVVCHETVNIKKPKNIFKIECEWAREDTPRKKKAKTNILLACHQEYRVFDMNCLTFNGWGLWEIGSEYFRGFFCVVVCRGFFLQFVVPTFSYYIIITFLLLAPF